MEVSASHQKKRKKNYEVLYTYKMLAYVHGNSHTTILTI